MMRFGLLALLALALSGCQVPENTVPPTLIARADEHILERAKPLPDIPKCKVPPAPIAPQKAYEQFVRCRAPYDKAERTQHVELAERHDAAAGYIERIAPGTQASEPRK